MARRLRIAPIAPSRPTSRSPGRYWLCQNQARLLSPSYFLQPSPTPIGESPAGVALVSVLVAPGVALSSVAFPALFVHVAVVRIGSLHAEGRGVAAWLFLRTANL